MSFEIKDKDLAGRIGRIETRGGRVETPAFFPVIHPFRQPKQISPSRIKELGFDQVITNAYIVLQKLGPDAEINIHDLLSFEGVVMTDSGAYQLLMYGRERVEIDPKLIVEFQERIGSDIAVIADIPTRDDAPYEEALESVRETLRRARLSAEIISTFKSGTVWVLPIQGGVHIDLVRKSAREALEIPGYGVYALGSPVTVLEKYEFWKVVEMVATAKAILPPDKPLHLFGGGHPLIIPLMVAMGVDSFDSASYILYARDGRYITGSGTYRLEDLDYLPCECEVCSRYSPEELRELPKEERTALLALHNLHAINREIKRVKVAIREGRLWELLEEKARTHPAIRQSLNTLIKYVEWVEKLDPRFKGDIHGIFLYDNTSYYRPELIRHRRFLKRITSTFKGTLVLLPGDPLQKPFRESDIYRKVKEEVGGGGKFVFYIPFFDLVPLEVDQVYPYSQFEMPLEVSRELTERMASKLRDLVVEALRRGSKVILYYSRRYGWSDLSTLRKYLEEIIERVEVREVN